MLVTCRYSAVEFEVKHFNIRANSIHPIFTFKTTQLLELMKPWMDGKLSETECRLLFTAMLKNSDLVDFRVAATPGVQVVAANIEQLAHFIAFKDSVPDADLVFPRIVISAENHDCQNAGQWIDLWREKKKEWELGQDVARSNLRLAQMEDTLIKLLKSPLGDQGRKVSRLADWAFVASGATIKGSKTFILPETRDYWKELFKLKPASLELYQASTVDLEELLEHMTKYLEHGSTFAAETMRHLRLLYARNKAGMLFALGAADLESDASILLDPIAMQKHPYSLIDEDVELQNQRISASKAPLEHPRPEQYPTKMAYLLAKSRWQTAQRVKAVDVEIEKKQQEWLMQAALDTISAEEEQEDAKQLALDIEIDVGPSGTVDDGDST